MEKMAAAAAYEAQRRRQIEENKRRIEELGLRHLAAAAMPPQAKQLKRKARAPGAPVVSMSAPPRRSGRVANLSDQPDYRENAKKNIGPTTAERSYAIAKAKELESELGADYPTFVRAMGYTSTTAFGLYLPAQFCREHLPKHSEVIMLVDEDDDEFYVQSMPDRHSYRVNGFKGFAMKHKLEDGDCLVFRLIQQRKFKVYIIRVRLT